MAGAQTTPIPAGLRTSASASSAAGARPRRRCGFESAYLYLLPAGLLILFVFGYPTIQSVLLSVQRNKGIRDPGRFIGIDNFVELWREPDLLAGHLADVRLDGRRGRRDHRPGLHPGA